MRISDWSSDVCSSDLPPRRGLPGSAARPRLPRHPASQHAQGRAHPAAAVLHGALRRGNASRRRRSARRFPRARARRGGGAGMNAQQKLLWVFGGIVALLALASLVGWALQRLKGLTEVVANLNSRRSEEHTSELQSQMRTSY